MARSSLVRCLFVTGCLLLVAPVANAQFNPGSRNEVYTIDGKTGRVIGINTLTPNGNAVAVVQGKDKFGNLVTRTKSLVINRTKLTAMFRSFPARLGVLSAVAQIAGYYLQDGAFIKDHGLPEGQYPNCPTSTVMVELPDGSRVQAAIPVPCMDRRYSDRTSIWSPVADPSLQEFHNAQGSPTRVTRWNGRSTQGMYNPEYFIYQRNHPRLGTGEPRPSPESKVPASTEEILDWVSKNPLALQEPDGWLDVWDPVDFDDTASEEEIKNPPKTPEIPDCVPGTDGCDIGEGSLNLADRFSFGSGWLPKTCPAPHQIPVEAPFFSKTFEFRWDPLCGFLTDIGSPIIRMLAIVAFLTIVFRSMRG